MLLLIGWMIGIFLFSSQIGMESGQMSDGICYRIVSAVNSVFDMDWGAEKMGEYTEFIHYPIRKLAHMTEYGILAVLTCWNIRLRSGEENRLQKLCMTQGNLFAFLFSLLYAITDEYHQTFVPGRAGTFFDVCVDSVGALAGLGIMTIVRRWHERKHKVGEGLEEGTGRDIRD